MHSAIVAIDHPTDDHRSRLASQAFLATITPLSIEPAAKQLDELVWLIDFQKSPATFARLVWACEHHGDLSNSATRRRASLASGRLLSENQLSGIFTMSP